MFRFVVRVLKTVAIVTSVVFTFLWMAILFAAVVPLFSFIRLRDPLGLRAREAKSFWIPRTARSQSLEQMTRLS
ncbi:MAG: hypothetical protein NUW37_06720 [Planctomycetes bacterium]|nr:hypothetical protein [Planctomycetota bacterium]